MTAVGPVNYRLTWLSETFTQTTFKVLELVTGSGQMLLSLKHNAEVTIQQHEKINFHFIYVVTQHTYDAFSNGGPLSRQTEHKLKWTPLACLWDSCSNKMWQNHKGASSAAFWKVPGGAHVNLSTYEQLEATAKRPRRCALTTVNNKEWIDTCLCFQSTVSELGFKWTLFTETERRHTAPATHRRQWMQQATSVPSNLKRFLASDWSRPGTALRSRVQCKRP